MKRGWLCLAWILWASLTVVGQSIVGPDQMNQCDRATFVATVTNASATQDACLLVITHTRPNEGFILVPGSASVILNETSETFDVDPVDGSWDIDSIRGTPYSLPPGETITVSYDLETTCAAVSGTDSITVDFEDCEDPGVPLQNVSSTSVEILPGAVVISKTPSVQDAAVGDIVTWTITVESTGLGIASNVEITDVLGSGLAFASATGGGTNTGQTVTWNAATTPALAAIAVGDTVSVDMSAEVISCSGLTNAADATWGCGAGDTCYDTVAAGGSATASLNLLVADPDLSFTAPSPVIPYCSSGTQVVVPIVNSGEGTARNVLLCCSLQLLEVANVQGGASYSEGCFSIPDIPAGGTFDLTFDVIYSGDWCTGGPAGTNVFELTYENDCGLPFIAYPQFSTLSSEPGPSLNVSKSTPPPLKLGEVASYDIAVSYAGNLECYSGSPGPVTIVDHVPDGFVVIDGNGGTYEGDTITWTYDPAVDLPFARTIQLQVPDDCTYCVGIAGTIPNTVTATAIDCCGCPLTGSATAQTTILCEGLDDVEFFHSAFAELSPAGPLRRCDPSVPNTFHVEHAYEFYDIPQLDDLFLDEFTYFVEGNSEVQYAGSLTVTGASVDSVTDATPAGNLEIRLVDDDVPVTGRTITFAYDLTYVDLDAATAPPCADETIDVDAGIELDPGATSVGFCTRMYGNEENPPTMAVEAPAMSVSVSGIPQIQEACATYDVLITLERTSTLAVPYDVRLVLTNHGGALIDPSQATCGGDCAPTDGTTCVSPIISGTTYEWRFADAFAGGDTATITLPITVRCDGSLGNVSVVATYDDLCHNDAVYDDSCSVSASDAASLSLSADVYVRKSPEILYATTRDVAWSVVVQNTGNGVAYNTWVDDILGSGLSYDAAASSISDPAGATESPDEDHEGQSVHGVSWRIAELQPGERRTITVAADLVGCSGLTNSVAAAWGCGEADCQTPRTDTSSVVIPPANLVATSYSPTPVPMCSVNPATVTAKNAGTSTVYNIDAVVTLPDGLVYLGSPEVQVNGGAWTSVSEPSGAPGPTLTWTSAEVPDLADAAPKDVIKIRFNYTVGCGFAGGNLTFQASYENPCTLLKQSNIGSFTIGLTPAELLVSVRQVDPPAGEAIDCGSPATWEIDVTNDGSIVIPATRVTATLDDGLTFVDSAGDGTYGPTDGGAHSGQTVVWELVDLPVDATATLSVTAASAGAGLDCEALDLFVDAAWGCGEVDGVSITNDVACSTTAPIQSSISATREPPLDMSASLAPDAIAACGESTTLTLALVNTSTVATVSYVDAVVTLPSEVAYVAGTTEIDCGAGFASAADPAVAGNTLTWYDVLAQAGADDACESIAPGGTIQLRFDADVSCYFTTQSIPVTAYFYDCCGLTQYDSSTSASLTALVPTLTIDKSPANTTLDCYDMGDTVTWTITVTNNGPGTADWIRVIDTLGSSLVLDGSDSPTAGAGVSMGDHVVGWEVGPFAPGATFTATVTAHAVQPSDDCFVALRRDTASVLWGCGSFDGDPNTTAEATCDIGSTLSDSATVRVPNLSIVPSDLTPSFTCTGDGVPSSSGVLQLVVRNTGDGAVSDDFEITLSDATTGYAVSDRFTNLGGTLPLAAGGSQTLTFSGWDVSCSACDYEISVALDFLGEICECREDDNLASLSTTITVPDLWIPSTELALTCADDGRLRLQGPITVGNSGCGDAVSGTLRWRITLYDGAGCSGNVVDTFTQSWTGVNVAAGGGTEQRSLNVVRDLDLCDLTHVSVLIEVDEDDAFCECSGLNNTLCAGTYDVARPDLVLTGLSVNVPDVCDPGTVDVTVENAGSGTAPAGITIQITGDATGTAVTPSLAPGASATVTVTLDAALTCGPKSIDVEVDPENAVCECRDAGNTTDTTFTVSDPDLSLSDLAAVCQWDGSVRITATLANLGDEASGDVTLRVLIDGVPIETTVVSLAPGGTLPIETVSDPLACGETHTVQVDIDNADFVCECNEDNNVLQTSATCPCPALSVDKTVVDIERDGDSVGSSGPVQPGDVVFYRFVVRNVGLGTAFDVEFSDTLPTGLVLETDAPADAGSYTVTDPSSSGTLSLIDGATTFATSIAATISAGGALTAEYAARVTSDITQGTDLVNVASAGGHRPDGSSIPAANAGLGDTSDDDAEDPDADDTGIVVLGATEPALSVDKTILDITRSGESLGIAGPVEPGDIVTYRFEIENVGDATAYHVEFEDTLPAGLVTQGGGTYTVTSPAASGSLGLSVGAASFTTAIAAEIDGGESLAATFDALVTSDVIQGVDLVNTAEARGIDGFGTAIPDENAAAGDTSDADAEDPDADDTGIAVIGAEEPALRVDKIITDIVRRGTSIGTVGPVEPGDVVFTRYTIANVGLGSAYNVGFSDTLPVGMVVETDAPGSAGTYVVSAPATAGSLGLADGADGFVADLGAVVGGGESLSADYTVRVTSDIVQGTQLINLAAATGLDGAGNPIPEENADLGDTFDDDAEDPDADDVGITVVETREPALSVDKRVTNVVRDGVSVGVVDPLLYEDVVEYTVTVRNVGLGTAYNVDLHDVLPSGLETETDAPGHSGTFTVSGPSSSGSLGLSDGASAFDTTIHATVAGGETLVAVYTVRVTPAAPPAIELINTASVTGEDGAGGSIPGENTAIGDASDDDEEDPDADDTGVAIVRVGSPALVTRKAVESIERQGAVMWDVPVEPGDIVTYEVGVTNVGSGPASNVCLTDALPDGFLYSGNTEAAWPTGGSTADPAGRPGPDLAWLLNASLEPGEELVLRFDATVTSEIQQGGTYTNVVAATGEDAAGVPIPPDHRDIVPEDTDPDDMSDVSLAAVVPALVTEKQILDVRRNGASLGPIDTIRSDDVITYRVDVTNVGAGTAYQVDLRDTLPAVMSFVEDTTAATWPRRIGTFTRNPSGAPGPLLWWDTGATLAPGETLTLTFDARVDASVSANPDAEYTNLFEAWGLDGAGTSIPANRELDVPEDVDPDDRDDVIVVATAVENVPALVTSKRITDLVRSGRSTSDRRIEEGDILEYEVSVENVGTADALNVNLTDILPTGFGYVSETTSASWPLGIAFDDPVETSGTLTWELDATLRPGDRLVLRFLAFIIGPVYDGAPYINTVQASGIDADGSPIPTDQRLRVPADNDPDDASQALSIGRSSLIQGEGGVVAVPILRKSAEVVGAATCDAWQATADSLWFQTDIAMYAAAEFSVLANVENVPAVRANVLLPTWVRTVQSEAEAYAASNLLHVDVLSSLGVPLSAGPLVRERADEMGVSASAALRLRLQELANQAGVSEENVPTPDQWIYLEYAGGEPTFDTWNDGPLGIEGRWTVVQEDLVASALGMGLAQQLHTAASLCGSSQSTDRYLGSVLIEAISNKIVALESELTADGAVSYVPHLHRWDETAEAFEVADDRSVLFDQLSLIWGLSEALAFIDAFPEAWGMDGSELRARVRAAAEAGLHDALQAVATFHWTKEDNWIGASSSAESATTVDVGLLLVALAAAEPVADPEDAAVTSQLAAAARAELVKRQTPNGWFSSSGGEQDASLTLASQAAAIRGLLAGEPHADAIDAARAAFDVLDRVLWIEEIGNGVYASTTDTLSTCYTALDVGLVVGALRELAAISEGEPRSLLLSRIASVVRTVVDEAALQLSNALPVGASFTNAEDARAIAPLSVDASSPWAPVLQQRLCLEHPSPDTICGTWAQETSDPWYQTDVSMLAAYVVQDRLPGLEDYADSNLHAVALYAGLGIPLEVPATLSPRLTQLEPAVHPIAIPYAGGSPELSGSGLAWDETTFDERIAASAVGATLLREAQEARQMLESPSGTELEEIQLQLLIASILQQLAALEELQIAGPTGVSYVPHASQWAIGTPTLLDASSTTFDQACLLLGLSEAHALLNDARVGMYVGSSSASDWDQRVFTLTSDVLHTLEVAHLDVGFGVLMDVAEPSAGTAWIRETRVSTSALGLLTTAFDHVLDAFGTNSALGTRAARLITDEVAFLQEQLMDPRGGFRESWPLMDAATACDTPTVLGQLGALQALIAADAWFDLDQEMIASELRTFDARFWDAVLSVYRAPTLSLQWCVTPLELALAVDVLSRGAPYLSVESATRLARRLRLHVDRILDGIPLQLSDGRALIESVADAWAPVFDARACLSARNVLQDLGWASPGDIVRFVVSAENASEETFLSLVLEDRLPDGVQLVSVDPVGEITEDGLVRWAFDMLAPDEVRTWELLVKVPEEEAPDVLTNCATLTYTDAEGSPLPEREACADVSIVTAEAGVPAIMTSARFVYRTDEAMHLSASLDALGRLGDVDAPTAGLAIALADANLGVLLSASGLGVDTAYAHLLGGETEDATTNGQPLTAPFAFVAPIVLPFESGQPILSGAQGFDITSDALLPAALGWTLVREAQYVDAHHDDESTLPVDLCVWLDLVLRAQIAWIADNLRTDADGVQVLPQTSKATWSEGGLAFTVVDPGSTVYDQAALLLGLVTVAESAAVSSDVRQHAETLAAEILEGVLRHWNADLPGFIDALPTPEGSGSVATWADQAVAVQAAARAMVVLPEYADRIVDLLEQAADAAVRAGPAVLISEEIGRCLVLLVAADSSADSGSLQEALSSWTRVLEKAYDVDRVFTLSPAAYRGWGDDPGQMALLCDVLNALSRIPEVADSVRRIASEWLRVDIVGEHVQLDTPDGIWSLHVQVPCEGPAPVLIRRLQAQPSWFNIVPAADALGL